MVSMEDGKKIAIGVTVLLLAIAGVRVGLIYKANHEAAAPPAAADTGPKLSDDEAVAFNLHKERPDSIKDERTLIGKTLWVSAGGQMDYYRYTAHHADYAHPVGILRGAEPMVIKEVFEQVPPKTGHATYRIPAGQRHVLLAFTMPKSADPTTEYAFPVGFYDAGSYTFFTDQIVFYDDPHILYKHWGADAWAHVDKHEVVLGMTEAQAMMALGQVIVPSSDSLGNRTVTYDNNGHPIDIVFENNKAVSIKPQT
jgi:hypothetical protein